MEQENEEDHDDNEEEEEEDDEEGGDEDENDEPVEEGTLYDLSDRKDLQGTLARLKELARHDAVRELLVRDEGGYTALNNVVLYGASLELIRAIWDERVAGSGPRVRSRPSRARR